MNFFGLAWVKVLILVILHLPLGAQEPPEWLFGDQESSSSSKAVTASVVRTQPIAFLVLARQYRYGTNGLRPDWVRALDYYNRALGAAEKFACHEIGEIWQSGGWGLEADLTKSVSVWALGMTSGCADCTWRLGRHKSLDPDPEVVKSGERLIRQAADNGSADALWYLGTRMVQSTDAIEAATGLSWLEKAASQGHGRSCFQLGILNEFGLGIKKDFYKAMYWYRECLGQLHGLACFRLGFLFEEGKGPKQNFTRAWELYQQGALLGNADCMYMAGRMMEEGRISYRDSVGACRQFQWAALQGHVLAMWKWAGCLRDGVGDIPRPELALPWYERAALLGSIDSSWQAAQIYLAQPEPDFEHVFSLLKEAASRGHRLASDRLEELIKEFPDKFRISEPESQIGGQ